MLDGIGRICEAMAVHWNHRKVFKHRHCLGPTFRDLDPVAPGKCPNVTGIFSKDPSSDESNAQLGLRTIETTEMPSLLCRRVNQSQEGQSA